MNDARLIGWCPGALGFYTWLTHIYIYIWHYIVLWSLSVQFVGWNRTFSVQEVSWARRSSRLVGEESELAELAATAVARVCNWNAKATTEITFHLFSDALVFGCSSVFFSPFIKGKEMCLSLSSEAEENPALRSPRFLLTSDSQSPRQLGIPPGREASVAKMPSNSHPDASYKLTVSQSVWWNQYPHPFTTSSQVAKSWSAQFWSGRLGITVSPKRWMVNRWMLKNDSNSWLFWGLDSSLTHFPRGPQFVLTEVKVSWILWSWQRVFWSWAMRRLSVHYPCHPLSTSHEQKSVSLGSQFFGRLRAYLIGAHVAGLVIPWAAGHAWAIGGSHGSHWGNRRWELTYDILRWFAIEIYTYFVTKSKHIKTYQNIVLHFLHFFLALSLDSGGQPDVHRERQSNRIHFLHLYSEICVFGFSQ